jgi:hypothetical protein
VQKRLFTEMLLFLKIYLSYLVVDFLIQPSWSFRDKRRVRDLLIHAVTFIIIALALINVDLTKRILLAILVLAVARAIEDFVKVNFSRDEWLAFSFDQIGNLLMIAIVSIYLGTNRGGNLQEIFNILTSSKKLYLFLSVYVAVVFGGGYFVQKVTQYFMRHIDEGLLQSKPGLPSAGKYIGWLERFLVVTFIVGGYPEGIGLLLAAKALVRYPEIKNDDKYHFAEYFLIGTLTSVALALLAGFALLKLRLRIS